MKLGRGFEKMNTDMETLNGRNQKARTFLFGLFNLERYIGFEPMTSTLARLRSTN